MKVDVFSSEPMIFCQRYMYEIELLFLAFIKLIPELMKVNSVTIRFSKSQINTKEIISTKKEKK